MSGRTLNDYLYNGSLGNISSYTHKRKTSMTDAEITARELREKRDRFAKKVVRDNNSDLCPPLERAAVLEMYREALEKINPQNHSQISAEVSMKVKIILGIDTAKPYHIAFTNSMLLRRLDPEYAHPRIETSNDDHKYRAETRLNAWRRLGWPAEYPLQAIAQENESGESLMEMGQTAEELMNKMLQWPAKEWGEEVNATTWRPAKNAREKRHA